jgi:hypothetical protein
MTEQTPDTMSEDVIVLDDLFILFKKDNGKYRAMFGPALRDLDKRLLRKAGREEYELAKGLLGIYGMKDFILPDAPELDPDGNHQQADLHELLKSADRLRTIANIGLSHMEEIAMGTRNEIRDLSDPYIAPAEKQRITCRLLRRFKKALQLIQTGSAAQVHRATTLIKWVSPKHITREMLISWVVLRTAKEMVQENGRLPTKKELRKRVEKNHPDARHLSTSQWADAFKESGLSSLPRSSTW